MSQTINPKVAEQMAIGAINSLEGITQEEAKLIYSKVLEVSTNESQRKFSQFPLSKEGPVVRIEWMREIWPSLSEHLRDSSCHMLRISLVTSTSTVWDIDRPEQKDVNENP